MPFRNLIPTSLIAALSASPVGAASRPPDVLKPSSAWNVNYGGDGCRLVRSFGTGEDIVFLIFDRFAPGQGFKLILAGKQFSSTSGKAQVRFGPSEAEQSLDFLAGDLGERRPAFIFRGTNNVDGAQGKLNDGDWAPPEPIPAERFAAIRQLTIGRPLRHPLVLEIGSMKGSFAALDKCIDNLLVTWGIDPAVNATLSRRPRPKNNPGRWITNEDYPSAARWRGAQGMVEFRLSVDATGKPSACYIQQSPRPPEFDAAVCNAMKRRASFDPALDKDGKPVASFFKSSVLFLMD
jgi:TonB family protein